MLAGGWCVVTAVDRRVSACRFARADAYRVEGADLAGSTALPEAVVEACTAGGVCPQDLSVDHLGADVRALFDEATGDKLGLGSSAASAVALSAACMFDGDGAVVDAPARRAIFERAFAAHRRLQHGRGSCADVAASSFGGVLGYRLLDPIAPFRPCPASPDITADITTDQTAIATDVRLPDGLRVEALWLGRPARSTSFVRRCELAMTRAAQATHEALCQTSQVAEAAMAAFAAGDAEGVVARAAEADAALDELGRQIEAPIVTDAHAALRHHADAHHIAVKPSGAGGGDFSLAFGATAAKWESFLQHLPRGIRHLPLKVGAEGVRRDA